MMILFLGDERIYTYVNVCLEAHQLLRQGSSSIFRPGTTFIACYRFSDRKVITEGNLLKRRSGILKNDPYAHK